MPTYLLKGFSTALQRYVFEVKEDGNQYYAYYSKRRSDIEPLYTSSLPVYNKSNRHFAQLYNDQDKSFSKYGTIKLVSYEFYRKQKNKLV